MESAAIKKPKKLDPLSPKNTLRAAWLNGQKARQAPSRASAAKLTYRYSPGRAISVSPSVHTTSWLTQRPSIMSSKLKALVSPTIHKKVSGRETHGELKAWIKTP